MKLGLNMTREEAKQKNEKIKEYGKQLQEKLKKLKEIETKVEKVRVILSSSFEFNKKQKEQIDNFLSDLKKEVKKNNKEELLELIEKINNISDYYEKIDEEKVKEYIDEIVAFIEKIEKEYNNSETQLKEKKDILQKDFKDFDKSSIVPYLNNLEKNIEEYTELIEEAKKIYMNLPKDTNLTELFIKQKAKVIDEYQKLREKSKDIINGSYGVQKIKDLINIGNSTKYKNINNFVKVACKYLVKNIKNNLEVITNNLDGIKNLIKKIDEPKLKQVMEKIKEKLSDSNSDNMLKVKEYFEKMGNLKYLNRQNLKKVIDDLKALNEKVNATQEKENIKSFFTKSVELQQNLVKIWRSETFIELLKDMPLYSEGMSFTDFIREFKKSYPKYEDDITVLLQIKFLTDDIKKILSSSTIAKEIERLFPKKNSNLRVLSPLSKKKKRGLDSVRQITCKMDQTFTEDDTLKTKTPNLNLYFLSEEQHDVTISQTLQISVKKEVFNCSTAHLTKLKSVYVFKSYSDLQVEKAKLRIKCKIHLRKVASFTRPSFFYILMKFRFKYAKHNLRRLDDYEDVDSYCLLNDETNSEDNVFQCYAYPDKINEMEKPEGIENIKSDYITVQSNSTEPDDDYSYSGINDYRTKKGSRLSGGAIAGIVIACVAVLAIIIGIVIYVRKKTTASPTEVNSSYATNANMRIS